MKTSLYLETESDTDVQSLLTIRADPANVYKKWFPEFQVSNPLNTKRRLLYLKTQFVPRSKHFSSRL